MASTKADNNRCAIRYVSDDGNNYAISAKAVYALDGTDGVKYGATAAQDADLRIPKDIKPRKIKCTSAGKPDKWVVVYNVTAAAWTTPGTTLTLDCNGVDTVYTTKPLKRNEKRRDTTRQTA